MPEIGTQTTRSTLDNLWCYDLDLNITSCIYTSATVCFLWKVLIASGADAEAAMPDNQTSLTAAAESGHLHVVEVSCQFQI